jgi:diguanylate cyclase (GGDEF)-like protein/PAS domain S-box-containing protein
VPPQARVRLAPPGAGTNEVEPAGASIVADGAPEATLFPPRRSDSAGLDAPVQASGPSQAWKWYLAVAAVFTFLYFVFPAHHLVLWTPLGLSSVAATLIGIRRHRPRQPVAWYLLAGAEFTFIAGDTTYNVLTQVFHQDNPFPSLADAFDLLTAPLLAAGIFVLIRGRSPMRDRASLIDAIIITTGLGLLSWIFLIVPNFQAEGLTGIQRVTSVAYPLGDVLVLAMLARLVGDGGLRIRSMQLLILGAVGLLASDVAYGLIQLNGVWAVGGPVDGGWVLFYVAWGCAALHPSMVEVSEILPRREARMGRVRLALLASVSLIAPAVQIITGAGAYATTVALFSAGLFLLVIARMWGILVIHQQSVEREHNLRTSSEALVAAQSLTGIYQVALDGVVGLMESTQVTAATIYATDGGALTQVAGFGAALDAVDVADLRRIARSGGGLNAAGTKSVTPLGSDDQRGMLVVDTATPVTIDLHNALSTLAAQVALAVESANLAEDLRARRNEERFRGILQNTSDIIVIVDARGEITYSTPSLGRHLGRVSEDLVGHNLAEFIYGNDAADAIALFAKSAAAGAQTQSLADWRLCHRDGSLVAFEVLSNNLLDDSRVDGIVLTMRDVSERRALEGQLKHQAFHDALTGLPNRALFQDRAEHALARMSRRQVVLAMVMLDLDDFKVVNDTRGHAAGDDLLVQVAQRLQAVFRHDATVSRFGGDEFAILIEDLNDVAQAQNFAERAARTFTTPFVVDGEELTVGVSLGLVVAGGTQDVLDMAGLLRCADLALYAAKEAGKGRVVLYHHDLSTRMLDRLTRRADLERAIDAREFVLHYQPIVLIETGDIVGCEALVRWQHPTRGLVPPLEFVELAEQTGLIVELGHWVLDHACAQMQAWAADGHQGLRLSVNVSARQLQEAAFVEDVRLALSRHQLAPGQLVLELTETIFASDADSIGEQLKSLRQIGVQVAMDDFGTGYSSLSYLQKFQLDVLKIDKSFVDGLGDDDQDGSALVTAIISLAHSLRLEVVAEGIETVAQRDELWSMGCAYGQGYLYSRPVPSEEIAMLLSSSIQLGPPAGTGQRAAARLEMATLRPAS